MSVRLTVCDAPFCRATQPALACGTPPLNPRAMCTFFAMPCLAFSPLKLRFHPTTHQPSLTTRRTQPNHTIPSTHAALQLRTPPTHPPQPSITQSPPIQPSIPRVSLPSTNESNPLSHPPTQFDNSGSLPNQPSNLYSPTQRDHPRGLRFRQAHPPTLRSRSTQSPTHVALGPLKSITHMALQVRSIGPRDLTGVRNHHPPTS